MNFDLASILSDASKGAGMFADLAVDITDNTAKQDQLSQVMKQQALSAQVAAEDIATTEGQAALVTQNSKLKIANTLGTNAGDSGYLIGEMGKRVIAADQDAQKALGVIKQKQSIDFIDNPLGYLYAQATIDGDIENYNGAIRSSELAKDTATKLDSMSQASFITQNALQQNVTESTIKSNAIVKGYQYGVAANEAAMQGLRTNLAGMQQSAQATAQAIDMKFKGFSADMQNKSYLNSLAHLDLARANFDLASEAKKAKLDEDSLISKFISKGYFNLSGNQLTPVKAKEMTQLYKAGQPEVRSMFNSGMQSYMISDDGSQSVISTSPYDAATLFGTGMVQNLPQAQKDVGDWLGARFKDFNSPAIQTKLGIDPKDKNGQEKAFNDFVKKQGIVDGKTGRGIYAPVAIETVTSANPNLAALPVWQKVLSPMSVAGSKLDNPDVVFGAVREAVKKGDISYNDALKLSTLYKAGVDMNNMSRNWIATGLPLGTGYTVNLRGRGEGVFTAGATVDLTNDNQVASYLNKNLAGGINFGNSPFLR